MLTQTIEPNAFTFSSMLKTCPLESGKSLHSEVIKLRYESDTYVRTALVDVYARGSDIVSARKLFDTMPERDVVCWNAMIDGYSQHGMPDEALVLFRQMLQSKVQPNEVTVVAALSACAQMGVLESGPWIHA
ncbi:hypothetical protein K7X08_008301 [Anisodus acutangulus]|uniref:Pentatricopeptide repeat-containing protein n=1 Tax=Anisodus acutangulus TaxID=402998 RepID=A0A9Q1MQE0_9SOLA|nr:hypothetical protein K7X08_008301 [Anisodus acutangulus]